MGFISDLRDKGISLDSGIGIPRREQFPGRNESIATWRELFGNVSQVKEEAYKQPPVRGGSYGRSVLSGGASYKRLLEAMRSGAPGGWSDDRYEQTRHWEGVAYIAGHRTGELLSQAEFKVYERDDNHQDGKRPVRKGHPGYGLVRLLESPNEQDSFGDLIYRWWQQMTLTGKALTWMVPNRLGTVKELYSIPTAMAIPQPAINPDFPQGYYRIQPIYPYGPFSSYPTPATAVGAPIPAQWMMDVKYPHPLLRYDGWSPLTALRLEMDEFAMIGRSRHYKMRRSFNPSAVLQMEEAEGSQPLPEQEIERIKAEFEGSHQGPENHGNLYVTYPGSKLEEFGSHPTDMDYPSGWDQLSSFLLAGLGTTRPAAGIVEDSSYSTLFATLKQLYWLTLDPACNRFAAALTRKVAPFFGDDLIVEIKCRKLDDQDQLIAKWNYLMQAKCVSKNEVRHKFELPATKEEWGEEMAGVEPQPMGPPGMGAAPMMPPFGAPPPQAGAPVPLQPPGGAPLPPDQMQEPTEIHASRQDPGNLSQGALGPRMKGLRARAKSKSSPLTRLKTVLDSLSEEELDGIYVYLNENTPNIVIIDVLDWGDPKIGDRIGRAAAKIIGSDEHVIFHNEEAKPEGDGWVQVDPTIKGTKSLRLKYQKAIHPSRLEELGLAGTTKMKSLAHQCSLYDQIKGALQNGHAEQNLNA